MSTHMCCAHHAAEQDGDDAAEFQAVGEHVAAIRQQYDQAALKGRVITTKVPGLYCKRSQQGKAHADDHRPDKDGQKGACSTQAGLQRGWLVEEDGQGFIEHDGHSVIENAL